MKFGLPLASLTMLATTPVAPPLPPWLLSVILLMMEFSVSVAGSTLMLTPLTVNVPAVMAVVIPAELSGFVVLTPLLTGFEVVMVEAEASCVTLIAYAPLTASEVAPAVRMGELPVGAVTAVVLAL